jgi:hypothetical protein
MALQNGIQTLRVQAEMKVDRKRIKEKRFTLSSFVSLKPYEDPQEIWMKFYSLNLGPF